MPPVPTTERDPQRSRAAALNLQGLLAHWTSAHLVVGLGRRRFRLRLRHGGSGLMLFFCSAHSDQCVAVMPNRRARRLISSMP
jgi:hypothetical protein